MPSDKPETLEEIAQKYWGEVLQDHACEDSDCTRCSRALMSALLSAQRLGMQKAIEIVSAKAEWFFERERSCNMTGRNSDTYAYARQETEKLAAELEKLSKEGK